MKKIFLLLLVLFGGLTSSEAKDGYKIKLSIKGLSDTGFYLAHYFAKPLPKIYKTDSGRLDKSGVAILSSDKKIVGGMYLVMLKDHQTYFEIILNNGDNLDISISDIKKLPGEGISIKGSADNIDFIKYEAFVQKIGLEHQELSDQLAKAKNSVDSASVKSKMTDKMKSLIEYRSQYVKDNPSTFLTKVFKGLELPKVDDTKKYLPNGEEDKDYAYRKYKSEFWNNFDLQDERMINTPVYDGRLSEYFNKLVVPDPDSIIKEADWILAKAKGSGDLFNYTLSFLSTFTQESNIMGMDKAYVHLVNQYFAKGAASWVSEENLQKHIDNAREISPTLLGNKGYDITMKDTSGKEVTVSKVDAKYKLIVIWDPTCGHCKKEIPQLDSVYKAEKLAQKGLKIFGICNEDIVPEWKKFIKEYKLNDWIHMHDPERKSRYRMYYNVRSSPTLYLLDRNGIIVGKRTDHSNIVTLIDMLERKEADMKKKNSSK
jgi:peroxiredoxin